MHRGVEKRVGVRTVVRDNKARVRENVKMGHGGRG